jgi:hypothetical protein
MDVRMFGFEYSMVRDIENLRAFTARKAYIVGFNHFCMEGCI